VFDVDATPGLTQRGWNLSLGRQQRRVGLERRDGTAPNVGIREAVGPIQRTAPDESTATAVVNGPEPGARN
jgi:hypothetical protein